MQFNLTRFWWLLQKHTAEHYKYYLMATGVLIGILSLIISFLMMVETSPMLPRKQVDVFVILLFLTGSVFTSLVLSDLGDKKKAIASLTLPASHMEKYLVGWLFSFVLFPLLYVGSFYLVIASLVPLDEWNGQEPQLMSMFSNEFGQRSVFLAFAVIHGIAFWGSVFFEKWQFIKTAFVFFLFMIALIFLNKYLMEGFLGRELESAMPFGNLSLKENGEFEFVQFPEEKRYLLAILPVGTSLLLWASTYFRLREKEV